MGHGSRVKKVKRVKAAAKRPPRGSLDAGAAAASLPPHRRTARVLQHRCKLDFSGGRSRFICALL
jgi:hypothetical protein